MAYDGAGSLFAVGMRLCKLAADGSVPTGATNCYVTDALVKVDVGLSMDTPNEVVQKNGAGAICLQYQPPSTVKGGTLKNLTVCTPDPNIMQFMLGGTVIEGTGATPPDIGYQAPAVGVAPVPNGISIEFWTRAILNGAVASSLPYYHWVLPRASVTLSSDMTAEEQNPLLPVFDATLSENPLWGTGPNSAWTGDSSRVWQYKREATVPDLTPGFVVVS
jgi:hypothetical protein